jgi:hypothetical protein
MVREMNARGFFAGLCLGLTVLAILVPQAEAEEKSPRLKYRTKGPVCSCDTGMDEEEIVRGRQRGQTAGTADVRTTEKLEELKPELPEPNNSVQPQQRGNK